MLENSTTGEFMLQITDAIAVEHSVFKAMFEQLKMIVPTFKSLHDIKAIGSLVEHLLEQHGEVEDEFVYAVLNLTLAEQQQVDAMRQEHQELNDKLAKLQGAANLAEACKLLKDVLAYSAHHFDYEESQVFPILKARMSEQGLSTLGEAVYLNQAGWWHRDGKANFTGCH